MLYDYNIRFRGRVRAKIEKVGHMEKQCRLLLCIIFVGVHDGIVPHVLYSCTSKFFSLAINQQYYY